MLQLQQGNERSTRGFVDSSSCVFVHVAVEMLDLGRKVASPRIRVRMKKKVRIEKRPIEQSLVVPGVEDDVVFAHDFWNVTLEDGSEISVSLLEINARRARAKRMIRICDLLIRMIIVILISTVFDAVTVVVRTSLLFRKRRQTLVRSRIESDIFVRR